MKKYALFFIVVIFVVSICGCATLEGASGGKVPGTEGAAGGVLERARQGWQAVLRADDWVKKILW